MEKLKSIIYILGIIIAISFWIGWFVFSFKMMKCANGDFKSEKNIRFNKMNLAFYPQYLTEDGLKARKKMIICAIGFPVTLLIFTIIGSIFGQV